MNRARTAATSRVMSQPSTRRATLPRALRRRPALPVHSGTSRAVSASGRNVSPASTARRRRRAGSTTREARSTGSSTGRSLQPSTPCSRRNSSLDPDDVARAAGLEHRFERERAAVGEVALNAPERSSSTQPDHPVGEVADVDHLHGPLGRCGREDRPAALDAPRPVREAVGRVVRPDDQARPDEDRPVAEGAFDLLLAERLQRAVVRVVIGRRSSGAPSASCSSGSLLDPRRVVVGVDEIDETKT